MKKLIFIDNDDLIIANETVENYVKKNLIHIGGLHSSYVDTIALVPDFYKLPKEEVYQMVFNPENAIITWSVYSNSFIANSKSQIIGVLRTAGQCNVQNSIYIDTTGNIENAVHSYIDNNEAKGVIEIQRAIDTNYIITLKNGIFQRLQVDVKMESTFQLVPFNLVRLLQAE